MSVVGSVTAEIVLDTQKFSKPLKTVIEQVESMSKIIKTASSGTSIESMAKKIKSLESSIKQVQDVFKNLNSEVNNTNNNLNRTANNARNVANALTGLRSKTTVYDRSNKYNTLIANEEKLNSLKNRKDYSIYDRVTKLKEVLALEEKISTYKNSRNNGAYDSTYSRLMRLKEVLSTEEKINQYKNKKDTSVYDRANKVREILALEEKISTYKNTRGNGEYNSTYKRLMHLKEILITEEKIKAAQNHRDNGAYDSTYKRVQRYNEVKVAAEEAAKIEEEGVLKAKRANDLMVQSQESRRNKARELTAEVTNYMNALNRKNSVEEIGVRWNNLSATAQLRTAEATQKRVMAINQEIAAEERKNVALQKEINELNQIAVNLNKAAEAEAKYAAESARNASIVATNKSRRANSSAYSSTSARTSQYTALANASNIAKTKLAEMELAMQRNATAASRTSGSLTTLTNVTYLLGRTARFMASMYLWSFGMELIEVAKSAVEAKSEMESYLDQMGLSTSQIDRFNEALDGTVSRFQKVNKYSMGEAVASLGVEFDLTTSQMTEAMDIVAMIQSEYVRAGRTQEEATLAVKDIMQGEFTRLSRETGVGKEELQAAGWSGDTKDIITLMDALEKVGTARHWDVFAAKATSLSDVITILQNRFAEFSADVVTGITPAIVTGFNAIISVFSFLSNAFNSLPDWAKTAIDVGVLSTAITTLTLALIGSKTGFGILEIANYGLTNSLLTAIFATDAETVSIVANTVATEENMAAVYAETAAQYGSINTLVAKITRLSAATVQEIGLANAVKAYVLGLNEENFAVARSITGHNSLAGAISAKAVAEAESTFETELGTLALRLKNEAITEEQYKTQMRNLIKEKDIALQKAETIATMTTTQAVLTKALTLDAELVAERGLANAILYKIVVHQQEKLTYADIYKWIVAKGVALKTEVTSLYESIVASFAKTSATTAETASQTGLISTIRAKLTALDMETIKNNLSLTAIAAKILGLDAEILSQNGLATAVAMTVSMEEAEIVANMSASQAILVKVMGLDAEILAEEGLISAISAKIAATYAEITATEGASTAQLLLNAVLSASNILYIAIAATIAMVVSVLINFISVNKAAAETMATYNDLVQNGDNIIKEAKTSLEEYNNSVSALEQQQQSATKGTAEYAKITNQLTQAKKDQKTAEENLADAEAATRKARSLDNWFSGQKSLIAIHDQQNLSESLQQVGYSAEFARLMSSNYLSEVARATVIIKKTRDGLQEIANTTTDLETGLAKSMKNAGLSEDVAKDFLLNMEQAKSQIEAGYEKMMTGTSLSDKFGGWLDMQLGYMQLYWTDFVGKIASGDYYGAFSDLFGSIGQSLSNSLKSFFNSNVDISELVRGFFDALGNAIANVDWLGVLAKLGEIFVEFEIGLYEAFWDGLGYVVDGGSAKVGEWFNSAIVKPIMDEINKFISDPLGYIGGVIGNIWDAIWNALFNNNESNQPPNSKMMKIDWWGIIKGILGTIPDIFSKVSEWFNTNLIEPINTWVTGFLADPLSYIITGVSDAANWIMKVLGFDDTFDGFTFISDWFTNSIITPITTWINGFLADPLSYIIVAVEGANNWVMKVLGFGGDYDATTFIHDWFMNYIITPITNEINLFLSDPLAYIGGVIQNTGNWILKMLGCSDEDIQNNSFGQNLYNLIVNGLTYVITNAPAIAYQVGVAVGQAIWNGLCSIPIIGPILQFIGDVTGLAPSAGNAGNQVGTQTNQGVNNGMGDIAGQVNDEFATIVSNITGYIGKAFDAAWQVGNSIWQGINSVLQRASPGFISKQVLAEFGTDIPNSIVSNVSTVYMAASQYGGAMAQAMQSQMANMTVAPSVDNANADVALAQYQADSQLAMGLAASTADTTASVFNAMDVSVGTSFQQMGTTANTQLTSMADKNTQTMTNINTTTTNQLTKMRSTTQNVTTQMTNAWLLMKNNIVTAANNLHTESDAHFNGLSNTIGTFYHKLQNPSMWGGPVKLTRRSTDSSRYSRAKQGMRSSFGRVAGHPSLVGSGPMPTGMMKIKDIISMVCPSGNCFNTTGLDLNATVDVASFLRSIAGDGGFGWNDWVSPNYNRIKSVSDEWSMVGPYIMHTIATGTTFQVKEFENGTPNISFASFQKMAEALFSAIPYDFYYDSAKTGSWVTALQSGSVNCWDGTQAILALARTCGFDGHMEHGSWNGIPHVYAVINGKKMDTTGWQNRRNWNGVSGGPSKASNSSDDNSTHITVNVDLRNSVVQDEESFKQFVSDTVVKEVISLTGRNVATGR